MTININFENSQTNLVKAEDTISGRAYINPQDSFTIYVCNPYNDVRLFSLCGDSLVFEKDYAQRLFEEVDLDITVKRK